MPIKPKDSRLIGWGRVKPRPQRLPKRNPIPEGLQIAEDSATGSRLSYNPPASSPSPLVTPLPFLPAHLRSTAKPPLPDPHTIPSMPEKPAQTMLNPQQIEEIRDQRMAGRSRKEIADQYSTTPFFVSLVAPLDKANKSTALAIQQEATARWSQRKQVYRDIRYAKRASWGFT